MGESFSEDVSAQCSGGRYLKFLNSSLPAAGLVWFFTPEEKREFDSRLALSGLFYVLSFPTSRKKPAEEKRMESMALAAGNKGLFLLPDAVHHPPPLQILP